MPKKTQNKKKEKSSKSKPSTDSGVEFSIERVYNAPREKVWRALTVSEEIKQWYIDLPEFKPIVGFEFQFLLGKDAKHLYKHVCTITEVDPGKKLAYSWQYEGYEGYSEVIFELFDEGPNTKVKVTHTGINTFPQDNEDFSSASFAEGWTFIVGTGLKEYVEKIKVIMFNMMTLDGFFEGEQKWELDWHTVDAEFNDFAINQLHSVDCILFGRVTYEGMAGYWSSEDAKKDDPIVAKLMIETPKVVFSYSLKKAYWENSTLAKGNIKEELSKLKEKFKNNLLVMGSANLSLKLMSLNLIDEFRIMVNPIILGKGSPLFTEIKQNLKLLGVRKFKSGNVLLYYTPIKI